MPSSPTGVRDDLFAILDHVMDPEVPVLSVVELGIVRDVRIDPSEIVVVITPTYSGCPAMHVIEADILAALRTAGVEHARLETVFSPPWTTDWMSDEAKRKLERYGIAAPGRTIDDEVLIPLTRRVPSVACPYCRSSNTELKSAFGSTACKSIRYCRDCQQPFEQFKAI